MNVCVREYVYSMNTIHVPLYAFTYHICLYFDEEENEINSLDGQNQTKDEIIVSVLR